MNKQADAPSDDILSLLRDEWSNGKKFKTTITLAGRKLEIEVQRLNWGERRAAYDGDDANTALMEMIPSRIRLAGGKPLFKIPPGESAAEILQNAIDPDVTRDLLNLLLTGEAEFENSKN